MPSVSSTPKIFILIWIVFGECAIRFVRNLRVAHLLCTNVISGKTSKTRLKWNRTLAKRACHKKHLIYNCFSIIKHIKQTMKNDTGASTTICYEHLVVLYAEMRANVAVVYVLLFSFFVWTLFISRFCHVLRIAWFTLIYTEIKCILYYGYTAIVVDLILCARCRIPFSAHIKHRWSYQSCYIIGK